MTEATHHFFHSFPRQRQGEARDAHLQRGMRILDAMFDVGLALAPERIIFRQPVIGGHKEFEHLQSRLCFTELPEDALPDHSARFGPFALRFDIDTLRRQGALPTIYIPQQIEGDRGLSAVGASLVAHLNYARKTLDQLHNLAHNCQENVMLALAKQNDPNVNSVSPDAVAKLNNVDEAGNVVATYEMPIKHVRQFLDFTGYNNAPYADMANAIRLVENLFYPTDDQIHDAALSYYRQREWRIIAGFGVPNHGDQARDLTQPERERLIAVDAAFWARQMQHEGQQFQRIERAKLIPANGHWNILRRANGIVCPASLAREVETRFKLPVTAVD
jgi:hypothetical protein